MILDDWFGSRGWTPFAFQREVWEAYANGESGLVHAATGTGKTLAAWGGPIAEWFAETGGRCRLHRSSHGEWRIADAS